MSVTFLSAAGRPSTARLVELASESHRRVAFIVVVCVLAGSALVVAGMPAWAFAVLATAFAARLWTVELRAQDARAAVRHREDEHAAEVQRRSQTHSKRLSEVEAGHKAQVARYEHLLAELRSGEGERRAAILEYRFRHAFGRPLEELEGRGWTVAVDEPSCMVQFRRGGEVKAEVPLNVLVPPRCSHELAAAARAHQGGTVTLEPALEES